ncbi:MAG: ribosome maturation factor RimP [Acidobacteriota bacterium]
MAVTEKLMELVERVVASEGLELVHADFRPAGRSSVLQVLIDKPGGVNLQDCQTVSQQLGAVLDLEDVIHKEYLLEVSSPGLDRPLYRLADYDRFQGRKAKLQTKAPIEGRRNFKGRIQGVQNQCVVFDDGKQKLEIPFENIHRANLIFELER